MTASTPYRVENWKDPEMLFGEEYEPFNLIRDLNGYTASDYGVFESESVFEHTMPKAESFEDEAKEDVKGDLYTSQGLFNLNTISSEEDQRQECINEAVPMSESPRQIANRNGSDMVQVRHISEDGPMIFVTKVRLNRILKQRVKRKAFLKLRPEYGLPYKQRSKDIKYKTRSKMAKNRQRNSLGKFATLKGEQEESIFELDTNEMFDNTRWRTKRKL